MIRFCDSATRAFHILHADRGNVATYSMSRIDDSQAMTTGDCTMFRLIQGIAKRSS
jgi:hypothetical protein